MRISLANTGYMHESLSVMLIEKLKEERKGRSTFCATFPYKNLAVEDEGLLSTIETLNPIHTFQHTASSALLEFSNQNYAILSLSSGVDIYITAVGDKEWVQQFVQRDRKVIEQKAHIRWHYWSRAGNSMSSRDFVVEEPSPIYDEYYPFIEGGVEKYFDDYFTSKASIIIMVGEPGTGKTSLIRWLIWKRHLSAQVTFDETVMAQEQYFIEYACSERFNLMVLEDCDLLLASRASDQNKLMAKLLNISDGLIKLDQKKMIFSTNLSNMNKIDAALVRSGRCFDVLQFRQLNHSEAEAAASRAGLSNRHFGKEVTLADIFCGNDRKREFKLLKMA